jgi:hypothetical protein
MVRNMTSTQTIPSGRSNTVDAWPPEVAGLLAEVDQLLEQGQPQAALERLARAKGSSAWLTNAVGVCRLRLGDTKVAVDVFRGLVLASGGLLLRDDVPVVFKVNFATAVIAAGNLSGGLRTLTEVRDESHPAVREVRDAIRRWESGMTFWQRLWWSVGGEPPRPLVFDFPPGRLA